MVLVIGDGLVGIDGELHEFDQDTKPDYVGYHLKEDFEDWYSRQQQKCCLIRQKISALRQMAFSPLHHRYNPLCHGLLTP